MILPRLVQKAIALAHNALQEAHSAIEPKCPGCTNEYLQEHPLTPNQSTFQCQDSEAMIYLEAVMRKYRVCPHWGFRDRTDLPQPVDNELRPSAADYII